MGEIRCFLPVQVLSWNTITQHSYVATADSELEKTYLPTPMDQSKGNGNQQSAACEKKTVRTFVTTDSSGTKRVTETIITSPSGKITTTREEKFEPNKGGMQIENRRDTASSSAPSGSGVKAKPQTTVTMKEFQEKAVEAHNHRRSRHGVPPLKLSSDLNDYAQKWAEHLVSINAFQHSKCTLNGQRIGENIAFKQSSFGDDYSGEDATESWYSEIKDHNFNSENSSRSGHFTQVVWKDSKEMGIGKAKSSDGKTVIVVASYRPAGNMMGAFAKNVFPPK